MTTLNEGNYSKRRTASALETKEYGLAKVEDLTMVLYAHRAAGRLSGQVYLFLSTSSYSCNGSYWTHWLTVWLSRADSFHLILGVKFLKMCNLEELAIIGRDGFRDVELVYEMDLDEVWDSYYSKIANLDGFGPFRKESVAVNIHLHCRVTSFSKGPTMPIRKVVDGYK